MLLKARSCYLWTEFDKNAPLSWIRLGNIHRHSITPDPRDPWSRKFLNFLKHDVWERSVGPGGGGGGGLRVPPTKSMKDPTMLFKGWTYIKVELTCKKRGKYLQNLVTFWDLKIWQNWDFASTPVTKIHVTRSIFEIEGSSFGLRLIFVFSKKSYFES